MDDRHFQIALELVLKHEGGYVNRASDKGGETKYGISKKSYPHLDIKNLTERDASRIYKSDYWDRGRYGMIESREIACRAFDLGVNCGVSNSIKFLQRAYNWLNPQSLFGLDEDGILGPKTASAINSYRHPKAFMSALKRKAQDYYYSLHQPENFAGWLNRLEG